MEVLFIMFKNKFLISEDNQDIIEVLASNGCEISHIYKNLKQKGSRL